MRQIIVPLACERDGDILGTGTILRIEEAFSRYEPGCSKFVLGAGFHARAKNQNEPFSILMRDWLIEKGVDEKDIECFNVRNVTNTADEIFFAKSCVTNEKIILIVTSQMHCKRTEFICTTCVGLCKTPHMVPVDHHYSRIYEFLAFLNAKQLWWRKGRSNARVWNQ